MLILASRATIADLGLATRLLSHDVGLGVFSFGAILIPLGVLNLVLNFLIHPQNEHAILEMLQDGTAPTHVWLASVLTAAIVAPLVEEFLFRGIVQGFLEKVFGPLSWTPILISSTFFAAVHINGDSPAPIPLFFFALVLGYLYRQTHRLWPCIVLHMCLNATSLAIMWFFAGNPELVNTSFILNWF
jgi:membrane protease YdiL (CAAX protease family)